MSRPWGSTCVDVHSSHSPACTLCQLPALPTIPQRSLPARCPLSPTHLPAVWAFAKLGHYDGPLMTTMAAEATRRIDEFRCGSCLLWAPSSHAQGLGCTPLPCTAAVDALPVPGSRPLAFPRAHCP